MSSGLLGRASLLLNKADRINTDTLQRWGEVGGEGQLNME